MVKKFITYYLTAIVLLILYNKYFKELVIPFKTDEIKPDLRKIDNKGIQQTSEWDMIALNNAFLYNIPVQIILGIIYVESRGSEMSIGSIGETGLMQLTNSALIDINMREANMLDPVQNIQAGTKYLRHLYNLTFDLNLAIQSYNQGYSRVRQSPDAGKTYLNKVLTASGYFT